MSNFGAFTSDFAINTINFPTYTSKSEKEQLVKGFISWNVEVITTGKNR